MKRSHIIVIGVAALGILAAALLMPKHTDHNGIRPLSASKGGETAKTEPSANAAKAKRKTSGFNEEAALVIDGKAVDPLCFANRSPEDEILSYPVSGCTESGLMADPKAEEAPFGPQFLSTAYISGTDKDVHGLIGYRYLGEVNGHKAVWLVENGGGSGIFSSLVLLDLRADEKAGGKILVPFKGMAFGDRCNGGVSDAQILNGKLVYERDVTPYEIMSLTGDPDRPVLQSDEMDQLPSCAICCYGKAQYEGERFTGILFDKRLPEGIAGKAYGDENGVGKCFDDELLAALKRNKYYINAEDFAAFVDTVEQRCFKPAEDEE